MEVENSHMNEKNPTDAIKLAPDERIEIIRFGELQEGDVLIGSSGRTTVVNGFDPHIPESMYVLETTSGIELRLSGNHLIYVVTANDRDLHKMRLAEGKRIGKLVSPHALDTLEELAYSDDDKYAFIAEFDRLITPKVEGTQDMFIRIAESIGPVSESHLYVDDLGGREKPLYSALIHNYDRRMFAQQALSVMNIGKSRKLWPVIVGTVMTVGDLLSHDPSSIYIPDPPAVL